MKDYLVHCVKERRRVTRGWSIRGEGGFEAGAEENARGAMDPKRFTTNGGPIWTLGQVLCAGS